MFIVRFALPLIIGLVLLLLTTAKWWTRWLVDFVHWAKERLEEAADNLKNIGK